MKLLLSAAGSAEMRQGTTQVSPIVLLADHQTAGRGRLNRSWQAPPGSSLLMTIGLPLTAIAADRRSLLTNCLALAVIDALHQLDINQVGIKWPNDLVCEPDPVSESTADSKQALSADGNTQGYYKLGGILAEIHQIPRLGDCALLGLGLNVNWPEVPTELLGIASSLNKIAGHEISREDLVIYLLRSLDAQWLPILEEPDSSLAVIFETYRARSASLGRRVHVTLPQGELVGLATNLSPEGALLLLDDAGTEHVVTVGDVVHLRPTS